MDIPYCRLSPIYNKSHLDIYESYYISKFKPIDNIVGVYEDDLELILPELVITDFIEIQDLSLDKIDSKTEEGLSEMA